MAEYQLYLGRINGREVFDSPEIKYVFEGIEYNRILLPRFPVSESDKIIRRVVDRLDTLGIDGTCYVNMALMPDLPDVLARYGFVYRSSGKCMALDLASFRSDDATLPEGVVVQRAICREDRGMWAKTMIASYEYDDDVHQAHGRYLTVSVNNGNDMRRLYLGMLDGKPVATAALFNGSETAGIYSVGTIPEARRNGIGTAMIQFILNEVQTSGYKIATLEASTKGYGIYQKLGFIDYFTQNSYYRKPRQHVL
jgi:ribosomal protein S18 acetylase RimI-like enzyme